MIDEISLLGFKSFPKEKIKTKSLTLFSGVNNSGKSSIIQAVRMYERAHKGVSPLLEGHGQVSELRSKFSSPSVNIEIELFFDGKGDAMRLSDQGVSAPSHSPVIFYIGADRLGPQTSLPLNRSLDFHPIIGERGEFVLDLIWKLNDAIIPELLIHENSQGSTLEYVLAGWLGEIAPGVEFSFKTTPKADLAHAEIDNVRPKNTGFGISYTLPIIAAILGMASIAPSQGWSNSWGEQWERNKREKGALILLENPEAHLHPQGQTAMGRLIAFAASCGVQVFVESHSDHLMDGIRIAVKEGVIHPDAVAFHFLSKSVEGISQVESPSLHSSGKLDYWPKGFFDQTLRNRAVLAKKGN